MPSITIRSATAAHSSAITGTVPTFRFSIRGLQDISASVDFTRLAEAAVDCGLDVAGFTTQAHFLLGCGLDTLLAEAVSGDENSMQRCHAR
ncbi:MAG: hypothetical protein U5P41_11095 [Gammaproteobacteria bacterium]|nr:hypothetical protein [Gammaproteobacteria bacterium]